jgi:serine/threonine protein kinase
MNKKYKDIQGYFLETNKIIGSGKYGKVYKGIREKDNYPVAIKVISTISFDKKLLKNLDVEWSTLMKINCDKIVKVYDVRVLFKNNHLEIVNQNVYNNGILQRRRFI